MHAIDLQPPTQRRRPWTDWAAAALLFGAVWTVYARVLDAPFICDDAPAIVENDSLRRLWPLWGSAEKRGPLNPARNLPTSGRPLVNLSFALDYQLHALRPGGYRLVNVLLHAVNTLLVAALVRRTLRLPYFGDRFEHAAGLLAFAAALVWAVHPLLTETIAYITQRTELVVSLCYLATLYFSLRYWTVAPLPLGEGSHPALSQRERAQKSRWLALAIVAALAGMASKEVMVTAPLVVLLFDRTFISGSLAKAWRDSHPLYIGLFASWSLLLLLNFASPRMNSAGFHLEVSAVDYWMTQAKVLVMYAKLAVLPWPLSIHYAVPYVTSLADGWMYILPVAGLVAVTLVLLWLNRPAGWVGAFVFAILAPTLIVPIVTEVAAERRMYLPLAAMVALVVTAAYRVLCQVFDTRRALLSVVGICVLLAFGGAALSRNRLTAYGDELAIWQEVIKHQPENSVAHYNVGTIYLERSDPQLAAKHFTRAVEIRPEYPEAHHNLGAALSALGKADEATASFEKSIAVQPRYALGHVKLGWTALQAGRTDEARKHFEQAVRSQPTNAEARSALAEILSKAGELDAALEHARAAVDANPRDAAAQNQLGAILVQQDDMAGAVGYFEAAVRLDPDSVQAQGNLMAAYGALGRRNEALATAEKALAAARAAGDKSMVSQIEKFLEHYQSQAPGGISN